MYAFVIRCRYRRITDMAPLPPYSVHIAFPAIFPYSGGRSGKCSRAHTLTYHQRSGRFWYKTDRKEINFTVCHL